MVDKPNAERREHRRISAEMKIRALPLKEEDAATIDETQCIPSGDDIDAAEGIIYTDSIDLSEGGLRAVGSLGAGAGFPVRGSRYLVEFFMPPPSGQGVTIQARLMWASPAQDGKIVVGLRFDTASPREMTRIKEFINDFNSVSQTVGD